MLNSLNVIVTQPALFQMLTLCQKHSNVEWSGYCLHEKKGDLFNETIIVHGVYLMDIGSATATDFKGNPDVATLVDEYPEIGDLIFGRGYRILQCKVHSHQDMGAFFSNGNPSDQKDLEDNSKGQDLYVSIVVNNKMEFFAKACRWVKTEKTQKTVQVLNKSKYQPYTYEVPAGEEKMVQNCNVKIDMQHPDWFNKRLTEVKPLPILKPAYNYTVPGGLNTGWGGTYLPKSVAQQREFDFYSEPVEEDDYTFDDELKFVFGLPKKCEPEVYLRTEKVDMEVMKENLSTYGKKAEDEFFDQLAVWVISADLQESPFYNQITKFLTSVEF